MWYLVIVFFASGFPNVGPAHFEDNWYPQPMANFNMCNRVGMSVLTHLTMSTTLRGEGYEVACISADDLSGLSDTIRTQWTFEPAPTEPPVPDAPA